MPLTPQQQADIVNVYLETVKTQINAAVAAVDGGVEAPQLGSIISTYARTNPIPESRTTLWNQLLNVPGIVWVSAVLAVTFGVLSLTTPALSDIAKVFAGAVVGGAGAGGIAVAGKKS